mgnify:CR=1 FL=1
MQPIRAAMLTMKDNFYDEPNRRALSLDELADRLIQTQPVRGEAGAVGAPTKHVPPHTLREWLPGWKIVQFLRDPRWIDPCASLREPWLARDTGAAETLASYGIAEAERRDLDTVHAEALRNVPVAHARWLADRIPGARLEAVPGGGISTIARVEDALARLNG